MKRFAITTAVILLASNAAFGQQELSPAARAMTERGAEMLKKIEAETKAEVTKYIYCSEVAAVEMDDGISDVATVAVGIQSVCGAELQTLARISATPQATWVSSLHPHVVATILARRVKLQKAKKKT